MCDSLFCWVNSRENKKSAPQMERFGSWEGAEKQGRNGGIHQAGEKRGGIAQPGAKMAFQEKYWICRILEKS